MRKVIILVFALILACAPKQKEQKKEANFYNYDVEERVKELGIELHKAKPPTTMKIELAVQNGNMLYLSGNVPFSPSGERYVGKLGSDLTIEEGYKAARLVGINHLSTLKTYLGDLNRVEKIVKVLGMVNSEPNFTDQSKVMNGFSDLMYEVFGDRGKHARSAVGMAAIPFNGACEIEMIVQIRESNSTTSKTTEPVTYTKTENIMTTTNKSLISAADLLKIQKNKNLIIIDTRMGKDIKNVYQKNHLSGALHVDLNSDLSDIKENLANGGRHPLPSLKKFSETLTSLGISPESHVVAYDDKNGSIASARLWWMLKSIGHVNVQVLNGGLKEAEKVGFPMSSDIETKKIVSKYPIDKWKLPLTTIDEVEKNSKDKKHLIIDVRSKERFNGETEPIDLVAGHIPGAINVPFTTNLDENGLYLSSVELKKKYQNIIENRPSKNVTVHCGSGVTACHSLLAMVHAGLEIPNLYVGSWSEWSRNNKIIATNIN